MQIALMKERTSSLMRLIGLSGLIAAIYLVTLVTQRIFDFVGISVDLYAASGGGQVLYYIIVLSCAALFTVIVWRQSIVDFLLLYIRNWKSGLGGFFFCAGLAFIIGFFWYLFALKIGGARWSSSAWDQIDAHELSKSLVLCFAATGVAITEEILFRSLAFKYLLTSTNEWVVARAILISAVLFALSHQYYDLSGWFRLDMVGLLIGLTLLGCLLALVYYLTDLLACAIGSHTGLIWLAVAKKTQIIQVAPSDWGISSSFDPRTEPAAWFLFVILLLSFWGIRRWIKPTFEIEDLGAIANGVPSTRFQGNEPNGGVVRWLDWFPAVSGSLLCVVGFFGVQKLTDYNWRHVAATKYPVAMTALKNGLTGMIDVETAAAAAGFRPGWYIRTEAQLMRRSNGQVEMRGFAADMPGDGTPLGVLVLADGKIIFQTQTAGSREDVTRRFMLTDAAARNVSFEGMLSCKSQERVRVFVVTPAMTYYPVPVHTICP